MIKPLGILFLLLAVAIAIISVILQLSVFSSSANGPGISISVLVITLIITLIVLSLNLVTTSANWRAPVHPKRATADTESDRPVQASIDVSRLKSALRHRYGLRWKRKLPWLLVMGEMTDVEAVAPGLTQSGWMTVGNTLLLWGGLLAAGGNTADLQALRRLRPHAPADALVWVSHEAHYTQAAQADAVLRGYEIVRHHLRWELPVYLLDRREEKWPQPERPVQLVGVFENKRLTPESLSSSVDSLLPELRAQGMAQISENLRHAFLLQLASDLKARLAGWAAAFKPLLNSYHPLPLYGVAFSPALVLHTYSPHEHSDSPIWRELSAGIHRRAGRPVGITARTVAKWSAATAMLVLAIGTIVSGISNYRLVTGSAEQVQQAKNSPSPAVLSSLQQKVQTLLTQQEQGTPLYRRFGLDVTDYLLPTLWPEYSALAERLIVQPAQKQLSATLVSSTPSYDALKTYLMLAHPDKNTGAEAQQYLALQLTPLLNNIAPQDIAFFASQLALHPGWKITPDTTAVAQARSALLNAMSGADAEQKLYGSLIYRTSRNFGDLSLTQLLDGQETGGMFTLAAEVPGSFTRQAYEGAIAPEIAALVIQRQEQVSWVLAEPEHPVETSLSPTALGERLTARYFAEYGTAWQKTLNQLKAHTAADPAGQLTLASDVSRSPQIALMKQLAWQGLAGSPNARRNELNPALQPVFGGIVSMASGAGKSNGLTLSAWRSQTAGLRDKMRNLSAASGGTAALSQSVFRGTQIDNTVSELPARLSVQLGSGWQPMAQALFLSPLSQTWKGVMTTGVKGMDAQWQQEIVAAWHKEFDNTFPFTGSQKDASLVALNDFINPQTGQIVSFIRGHLNGVLEYKENRWQKADKLPPGLTVSPAFLSKLNQLDRLGHALNDNGWGFRFKLQAGTARDVVQTGLSIDGQRLVYFNQMPFWADIQWPGDTYYPNAELVWTSVRAGARLYFDTPGTWAFYRLLKKAKISPVDDTHYQLTWTAEDGLPLNYRLAFTAGNDPVSLLSLDGFRLPDTIFR
ncbi:ImcF-related family protein [Rahnella sp. AA]|uniref:ImcF-related family protein n=1 Tax=Rahnella sp. AA TaxID=2057180 RepID=UPI001E375AF5|nr:ImcF-related family protein [Rahnella sp. AA]